MLTYHLDNAAPIPRRFCERKELQHSLALLPGYLNFPSTEHFREWLHSEEMGAILHPFLAISNSDFWRTGPRVNPPKTVFVKMDITQFDDSAMKHLLNKMKSLKNLKTYKINVSLLVYLATRHAYCLVER